MGTLEETLAQFRGIGLGKVALPDVGPIESAAKRVAQKWPYVTVRTTETDWRKIAAELRRRIEANDWKKVRVTEIVGYARVLFSPICSAEPEVGPLQEFLIEELSLSEQVSLVNGMADVYYESYETNSAVLKKFGAALYRRKDFLNSRWSLALASFPGVLNVGKAHVDIAEAMAKMELPHEELPYLGIVTPFEGGLMEHAHQVFIQKLAPQLSNRDGVEKLFNWIRPAPGVVRQAGAVAIVTALLSHWTARDPSDELRELIVENLIATYRDPRVDTGQWQGVDKSLMSIVYRWLTKADMYFFTGVVDDTPFEGKHMWPPRRDFWLSLYDQKKVAHAWVAFCDGARRMALSKMRTRGQTDTRFGRQQSTSGYGSTSLLIMKIGNKIVVDGCHSYKTQIFNEDDLGAPHFPWDEAASYDNRRMIYDAYEVRVRSKTSYRHYPQDSWERNVLWALRQNLPYTAEHERIKRQREQAAARNAAAAVVNTPTQNVRPAPTIQNIPPATPTVSTPQPVVSPAPTQTLATRAHQVAGSAQAIAAAAQVQHTRAVTPTVTAQNYSAQQRASVEGMFAHIDIDFAKLDDEVRYAFRILQQERLVNELVRNALEYVRTRRPLNGSQVKALAAALDLPAIAQLELRNLRKIVVPIFNRAMSDAELQIWRSKAEYFQSTARARNILSDKSNNGFASLRLGRKMDESEKKAVEFALQQMRIGGVHLMSALTKAGN